MVAQRDQNDRGDNDRDAHEEGLAEADHGLVPAGVRQVQPVDHRQPEARQRHRDREDHGVRVGRQEVHADLGDDGDGHQDADLREQVRGDLPRVVQRCEHVPGDADRQGQPHEGQLQKAARLGGRDRYGSHYEAPPLCAPDWGVPDCGMPDWVVEDEGDDTLSATERLRPSM